MIDNYKIRNRKYKISKVLDIGFDDEEFIGYKIFMDKYFSKEKLFKYKFLKYPDEFCYGEKDEIYFTYDIISNKITLLYPLIDILKEYYQIQDIRFRKDLHNNIGEAISIYMNLEMGNCYFCPITPKCVEIERID